jgi:hypothetical protein
MPLIQGGPPEWIWERTPEKLKWEVITSDRPDRQTLYELRVQCGLEIMRLQFFTAEEVRPWPRYWPNTGRSQGHKPATVDGRPRRDNPRLSPFSFGQSLALGKS